MDMVEKVVRAILKRRYFDCEPEAYGNDLVAFYGNLDPDHVIDAYDEARAAIEAMPKPSEDLILRLRAISITLKTAQTLGEIAVGKGQSPFETVDEAIALLAALSNTRETK